MNNFYVLFAYVLCMAHWIFFPSRWRIIGAFLTACWIIMVVTTISLQFNYIWYFSCLSQFFIYKDGCFCILFFHYHSDICLFFLFIHLFSLFLWLIELQAACVGLFSPKILSSLSLMIPYKLLLVFGAVGCVWHCSCSDGNVLSFCMCFLFFLWLSYLLFNVAGFYFYAWFILWMLVKFYVLNVF